MNQQISISELKQKMARQSLTIIDIRDNYQYQIGRIPTAINVPMNFLLTIPENYLQKDKVYYIYCEYGHRSSRTCSELRNLGYQVIDILGGYQAYQGNN